MHWNLPWNKSGSARYRAEFLLSTGIFIDIKKDSRYTILKKGGIVMDKQTKFLLAVVSIAAVVTVLACLLLSGYDISGIRIEKGFHLG